MDLYSERKVFGRETSRLIEIQVDGWDEINATSIIPVMTFVGGRGRAGDVIIKELQEIRS